MSNEPSSEGAGHSKKDAFDFSNDSTQPKVEAPREGKVYDSRPAEDGARRTIAYLLIAILATTVSWILVLLSMSVVKVADVKEFAVLLGPLVTLVSAATGFYYGTKSTK